MNKYTLGIILGFLGAGLNLPAYANQVLEQSPVIFEYSLTGPAVIESAPIVATGIIKSVSVSAESVGQVSLEVSTNGGNTYTKIINGLPLADGFIPGNQLRLKANIGSESSLKKLTIGYTDSSGVQKLYRNPDLASYKYHKEINISGGSQEVFNYPLHLNLSRPDIYFTAADGQTPLYYYLDSSSAAQNDSLACYVKVPQIPKEGAMIYLYYGVIAASPQPALSEAKVAPRNDVIASPPLNQWRAKQSQYNDGSKVFPFFDDFNGAVLNAEKWEIVPGLKKEYTVKDGSLQLKDGVILSRNFKSKQMSLEFKAMAEENAGIQVVVRSKIPAQGVSFYEQIVYSSNYPGAEHTIAINNIAKLNVSKPIQSLTYYMYKAVINATGILFERYSQIQQEKQAEIKFLDVGNFTEGYIGLKADAAVFNAGSVYFDWIRARPYVEVEPVAEGMR